MDDDQQFCLRWNNHQSTLISVFDTLLENGTLVDCTLAAEGKFLKAHKVVLSACSPYFATLLSQQYDKHPIFILKDVKFQELRAMMDYMYRGEVNISQDQLAALLKAAESLQIKGLSDNRSSSSSGSSGLAAGGVGAHQQQKQQSDASAAAKTLQPPVPASKASGLTIENKRPLKSELLESDVSGSREGSTSPTRKRKKVRRRSVDTNNLLIDNHDQHSNSSSHSIHTASGTGAGATTAGAGGAAVTGAPGAAAGSAGASSLSSSAVGVGGGAGGATPGSNSGANVLSAAAVAAVAAIKKTETAQQAVAAAELMKLQLQKQQIAAAAAAAAGQSSDDEERCGGPGSVATGTEHGDDGNELTDNEQDGDGGSSVKSGARHQHHREGRRGNKTSTSTVGDLLIEPKSEYEDGQDENIEDLTMDDEELMDELDQAGPSHGGDVSSQGYAQWPLDREQNEAFIAAQDAVGGQHRDAQAVAPVDSKVMAITHQSSLELPQLPPPPSCLMSPMCEFSSVCPRTSTQRLLTATLRAAAAVAAAASKSHLPPGMEDVTGGGVDEERRAGCCGDANSIVAANCAAGMMCGGNDASSSRCGATVATPTSASSAPSSSTSSAFKCPRCPRAYALSYTLERHMKYECGVAKQFGCVKCGKRFSRKDILKAHITNTKSHCAAAAAAAAYATYESS